MNSFKKTKLSLLKRFSFVTKQNEMCQEKYCVSKIVIQQREARFDNKNEDPDLPYFICHHRYGHPCSDHGDNTDYGPVSETAVVQRLG